MTQREDDARARLAANLGSAFELSRREDRWLALGEERVGFAADSDAEWQRLEREAWLLARWRAGGVPVPRVVHVDAVRRVQLRERLHGLHGTDIHRETGESRLFGGAAPDARARRAHAPLSAFGARLAESYGELGARIRRAVSAADARAAGLGATSRRAIDVDGALARFAQSHGSAAAKAAAMRARDWLVAIPPIDAVIHADLHFFNMCAGDDGTITALFDLGDAGLDAGEQELAYVHSLGAQFAAAAIAAYGPVDIDAVHRAHLRAALDHVNWHGPGTERHDAVIAWTTAAFEQLG